MREASIHLYGSRQKKKLDLMGFAGSARNASINGLGLSSAA